MKLWRQRPTRDKTANQAGSFQHPASASSNPSCNQIPNSQSSSPRKWVNSLIPSKLGSHLETADQAKQRTRALSSPSLEPVSCLVLSHPSSRLSDLAPSPASLRASSQTGSLASIAKSQAFRSDPSLPLSNTIPTHLNHDAMCLKPPLAPIVNPQPLSQPLPQNQTFTPIDHHQSASILDQTTTTKQETKPSSSWSDEDHLVDQAVAQSRSENRLAIEEKAVLDMLDSMSAISSSHDEPLATANASMVSHAKSFHTAVDSNNVQHGRDPQRSPALSKASSSSSSSFSTTSSATDSGAENRRTVKPSFRQTPLLDSKNPSQETPSAISRSSRGDGNGDGSSALGNRAGGIGSSDTPKKPLTLRCQTSPAAAYYDKSTATKSQMTAIRPRSTSPTKTTLHVQFNSEASKSLSDVATSGRQAMIRSPTLLTLHSPTQGTIASPTIMTPGLSSRSTANSPSTPSTAFTVASPRSPRFGRWSPVKDANAGYHLGQSEAETKHMSHRPPMLRRQMTDWTEATSIFSQGSDEPKSPQVTQLETAVLAEEEAANYSSVNPPPSTGKNVESVNNPSPLKCGPTHAKNAIEPDQASSISSARSSRYFSDSSISKSNKRSAPSSPVKAKDLIRFFEETASATPDNKRPAESLDVLTPMQKAASNTGINNSCDRSRGEAPNGSPTKALAPLVAWSSSPNLRTSAAPLAAPSAGSSVSPISVKLRARGVGPHRMRSRFVGLMIDGARAPWISPSSIEGSDDDDDDDGQHIAPSSAGSPTRPESVGYRHMGSTSSPSKQNRQFPSLQLPIGSDRLSHSRSASSPLNGLSKNAKSDVHLPALQVASTSQMAPSVTRAAASSTSPARGSVRLSGATSQSPLKSGVKNIIHAFSADRTALQDANTPRRSSQTAKSNSNAWTQLNLEAAEQRTDDIVEEGQSANSDLSLGTTASFRQRTEKGSLTLSNAPAIELSGESPSVQPILTDVLYYFNVHHDDPHWQRVQVVLLPSAVAMSWIPTGGGRQNVVLDLRACREVHSVPNPDHPSSMSDVGAVLARRQNLERTHPFQLIFDDGVERMATSTANERVKWVSSIWDILGASESSQIAQKPHRKPLPLDVRQLQWPPQEGTSALAKPFHTRSLTEPIDLNNLPNRSGSMASLTSLRRTFSVHPASGNEETLDRIASVWKSEVSSSDQRRSSIAEALATGPPIPPKDVSERFVDLALPQADHMRSWRREKLESASNPSQLRQVTLRGAKLVEKAPVKERSVSPSFTIEKRFDGQSPVKNDPLQPSESSGKPLSNKDKAWLIQPTRKEDLWTAVVSKVNENELSPLSHVDDFGPQTPHSEAIFNWTRSEKDCEIVPSDSASQRPPKADFDMVHSRMPFERRKMPSLIETSTRSEAIAAPFKKEEYDLRNVAAAADIRTPAQKLRDNVLHRLHSQPTTSTLLGQNEKNAEEQSVSGEIAADGLVVGSAARLGTVIEETQSQAQMAQTNTLLANIQPTTPSQYITRLGRAEGNAKRPNVPIDPESAFSFGSNSVITLQDVFKLLESLKDQQKTRVMRDQYLEGQVRDFQQVLGKLQTKASLSSRSLKNNEPSASSGQQSLHSSNQNAELAAMQQKLDKVLELVTNVVGAQANLPQPGSGSQNEGSLERIESTLHRLLERLQGADNVCGSKPATTRLHHGGKEQGPPAPALELDDRYDIQGAGLDRNSSQKTQTALSFLTDGESELGRVPPRSWVSAQGIPRVPPNSEWDSTSIRSNHRTVHSALRQTHQIKPDRVISAPISFSMADPSASGQKPDQTVRVHGDPVAGSTLPPPQPMPDPYPLNDDVSINMEAEIRKRRVSQMAASGVQVPQDQTGGWYIPKVTRQAAIREGVETAEYANVRSAKPERLTTDTDEAITPAGPVGSVLGTSDTKKRGSQQASKDKDHEGGAKPVSMAAVGTRGSPEISGTELASILGALKSNEEARQNQARQQAEIARYLNELNVWLEKDVVDRTKGWHTLAAGVAQLHDELSAIKQAGSAGMPLAGTSSVHPLPHADGEDVAVTMATLPTGMTGLASLPLDNGQYAKDGSGTKRSHTRIWHAKPSQGSRKNMDAWYQPDEPGEENAKSKSKSNPTRKHKAIAAASAVGGALLVRAALKEWEKCKAKQRDEDKPNVSSAANATAGGQPEAAAEMALPKEMEDRLKEAVQMGDQGRLENVVREAAEAGLGTQAILHLTELVQTSPNQDDGKKVEANPILVEEDPDAAVLDGETLLQSLPDKARSWKPFSETPDDDGENDSKPNTTTFADAGKSAASSSGPSLNALTLAVEEILKHLLERKQEDRQKQTDMAQLQAKQEAERQAMETQRQEALLQQQKALVEIQDKEKTELVNLIVSRLTEEKVREEASVSTKQKEIDPKTAIESLVIAINSQKEQESQVHANADKAIREMITELMKNAVEQNKNLVDAVNSAARDVVYHNVHLHAQELKTVLSKQVSDMFEDVGKIRETKRALEHEIADLFAIKAKHFVDHRGEPIGYQVTSPVPGGYHQPLSSLIPSTNINDQKKKKKDQKSFSSSSSSSAAVVAAGGGMNPLLNDTSSRDSTSSYFVPRAAR